MPSRPGLVLLLLAVSIAPAFAASGAEKPQLLVSTQWLAAQGPSIAVLDVATPGDYAAGHIPGARLLDISSLLEQPDGAPNELPPVGALEVVFTRAGIGDRTRVILYSRDPLLAARAWFTLDYLGHGRRAAILDGGYSKWTGEGRAVSKDESHSQPAPFRSAVDASTIVRLSAMRQLVRFQEMFSDRFTLIDARPAEQYQGSEAGPGVRRAGRIPGAVNVPWRENLTGGATPVMRPIRELCDLYAAAGVTGKTANTVYCRTGMQAAMTYFVLKYIGYHATLYDGSFIEWSHARDTLVVDFGTPFVPAPGRPCQTVAAKQ